MGVMPGVTWRPVPSHSGAMRDHLGLVLHVQVGDGSCYGEFANPANQASSTWWVPKHGTIGDLSAVEQYVDSDVAAWTEAAGNFTWDSVETEGTPDEPLTDYQVWAVAQIYRWGHDTYGWPFQLAEDPLAHGLGWHGMGGKAWGGHIGCPGDLRKAQRTDILAAAQPAPSTPPQEDEVPAPAVLVDANGDAFVFVRGTDGFLWFRKGHADWAQVPGTGLPGDKKLTSGPNVSQHPHGITVAMRGPDGATWVNTMYDGTWVGWDSYGGSS